MRTMRTMTAMPAAALRSQSAPSLPQARPLTPPESDSDRFQDSSNVYAQRDGPEPPLTPIRTPWSSGLLRDDFQQYPHTPESMPSTKAHAVRPLSPLPSVSWNSTLDLCSSPMQHALLSCAAQLENLIQTREPTDEQMEYLVSKFEEMARFLSAPEAQSKQTDDHLFSDVDAPHDATGLGIANEESMRPYSSPANDDDLALSQGYVLEVGKYIENVKMHVQDLTMRMDEVKQLNSIQLDIISDLRRELNNKSSQLRQEKDVRAQEQPVSNDVAPQKTGFWAAVGEALDAVGEMLHEW